MLVLRSYYNDIKKERSLLCFWAVRELGVSLTALARKLEMCIAGVGFAVERGEPIAKKKGFYADKLSY
ncbi:MAG: hypothetical protein DRH07_09280 [Deltaproteobacteria bacterium]|nr:MAG: hypothetical protein DRH07_09280 [Deltaproteobacteria bacterium]